MRPIQGITLRLREIEALRETYPEVYENLRELRNKIARWSEEVGKSVGTAQYVVIEGTTLDRYIDVIKERRNYRAILLGVKIGTASSGNYIDESGYVHINGQRITPVAGDIVLDSDNSVFYIYTGTQWQELDTYLKRDGSLAMTGDLDMDGHNVKNLPVSPTGDEAISAGRVLAWLSELHIDDIPGSADKANKVSGATAGNFASLTSDGDIQDSGKTATDFADAVHTHVEADITDLKHDAHWIQGYAVIVSGIADGYVLVYDSVNQQWVATQVSTAGIADNAIDANKIASNVDVSAKGFNADKVDGYEASEMLGWESVYTLTDIAITSYYSLTVSESYKHYKIRWSGFLDNGGNTTENYLYIRFNNDTTASYTGYRRANGTYSIAEWSATDAIEIARTVNYEDCNFDFTIDVYVNTKDAYGLCMVIAQGITYNPDTDKLESWYSSGAWNNTAIPTSIQVGIKTTGTGYQWNGALSMWRRR